MAIYTFLHAIQDQRSDPANRCTFNGFLEDYLMVIEEDESQRETYDCLMELFYFDRNFRICVNLNVLPCLDSVANQIIRYKDANRLAMGCIKIPFILYCENGEEQKAILLQEGYEESYIFAKALYFVASEPQNIFNEARNEIISCCCNQRCMPLLLEALHLFVQERKSGGRVQRFLDDSLFESYTEMYKIAMQFACVQCHDVEYTLQGKENPQECIMHFIGNWFLLKKFCYVQYMMDKENLRAVHENVKKQRHCAKEMADQILYVPYRNMWNYVS